jgi:hypothetical protein
MAQPALVWHLPEGVADEPLPQKRSPAAAHSTPQRWEPPVLQIPSGNTPATANGGKVEPTD